MKNVTTNNQPISITVTTSFGYQTGIRNSGHNVFG